MKATTSQTNLESLLESSSIRKYSTPVKRNKPYALVYTRVSSKEQAENNSSLETQTKICTEYARNHQLTIKKYFGGIADSAKTDGRKQFQQMLAYAKKDKEVAFIIVQDFDRFSRTGLAASKISKDLKEEGITLKAVMQDIDSTTAGGELQENVIHLINHFDNRQKSLRTKTNTKEVMEKGYWPYKTPLGYENLKPKQRACDHVYRITEQGKWLKKAFYWKAEGILTNKEIIEKINSSGLRLTEKNFRWIISNTFYVGYVK